MMQGPQDHGPRTTVPAFFADPGRVAALRAEAGAWRGTPFREGGRVKGRFGGVDCTGFVLACYVAAGLIADGEVIVGPYEVDHYEHSDVSLLEEWFRTPAVRARMPRCDEAEPRMDGDLIFVRHRRAVHHVALWLDGRVWHTMRGQGLIDTRPSMLERLGGEIRAHYRPLIPSLPHSLAPSPA